MTHVTDTDSMHGDNITHLLAMMMLTIEALKARGASARAEALALRAFNGSSAHAGSAGGLPPLHHALARTIAAQRAADPSLTGNQVLAQLGAAAVQFIGGDEADPLLRIAKAHTLVAGVMSEMARQTGVTGLDTMGWRPH